MLGRSFLSAMAAATPVCLEGAQVRRPWQRTAINTEAKYLMLRHAFEELGCIRVELKTDALNQRSRTAVRAGAAGSKARAHWSPGDASGHHRQHDKSAASALRIVRPVRELENPTRAEFTCSHAVWTLRSQDPTFPDRLVASAERR